jgi:hypothetical protein
MMQVIDGEVGVVGGETAPAKNGKGTELAVVEIGDHLLEKILLADDLQNRLEPGKYARLLVRHGLSRGLVTRPFIAALEVDGRKTKTRRVLPMALLRVGLCVLAFALLSRVSMPLAAAVCAGIAAFTLKDWLDLARF